MTRFDRDTAVRDLGDGCYEGRVDPGWWIIHGPNGGYVAAIVLRALQAAVGDPARAPRSLTLHYTAPPQEGPVHVETIIERTGRSLTTVSARLEQQGKLLALALAAFSRPRESAGLEDARMPEAEPPDACALVPQPEVPFPFREHFELRQALGAPPFAGAPEAYTGGWLRLREPAPLDAPRVAAFTDAWTPAVLSWAKPGSLRGGIPTVDLTIHFRASLPQPTIAPDAFALVAFRTRTVRDGFLEEDGEVWSPDGTLLAQSRQLAILV